MGESLAKELWLIVVCTTYGHKMYFHINSLEKKTHWMLLPVVYQGWTEGHLEVISHSFQAINNVSPALFQCCFNHLPSKAIEAASFPRLFCEKEEKAYTCTCLCSG